MTPETYFSAIFPLLDDESKEGRFGGVEAKIVDFNVAVCYLLSFVFPLLPQEMLRAEAENNGRLYATFAHSMRRFHLVAPFVRSACGCVCALLSAHAQDDWKDDRESLGELFLLLLGWSIDARPKVRKVAQEAVSSLVLESGSASALACEFASTALLNATRKDPSTVMQLLPLCKTLLSLPVSEATDNLVSGLLHDLTLGNTSLSCLIYSTLEQFANAATEGPVEVDGPIYGRVYKRLLDGLLKTPPVEVAEIAVALLGALAALSGATIAIQVQLGKEPEALKCTQSTLNVLLSGYFAAAQVPEVLLAAAQATHSFCSSIVSLESSLPLVEVLNGVAALMAPLIPGNGKALADALTLARFTALMPVLTGLIEASKQVEPFLSLLVTTARLHDTKFMAQDTRVEVIKMFSAAVKIGGIPMILEHLPLCLLNSGNGSIPRAWLVPVLRDGCWNGRLSDWMNLLKPEADAVAGKAVQFSAAGKVQEARVWEALHFQLLCVLPSLLASHPIDFHEQGEEFRTLVVQLLNDHVQLRPTLMAALLKFCQNVSVIEEVDLVRSVIDGEADAEVLQSAWLPLLLPVLFNIYASTAANATTTTIHDDEDAGNDLTLKLISVLLSFAPAALIEEYFSKTVGRIARLAESNPGMLGTVLDLASTMIPHASASALEGSFLPVCLELIKNSTPASISVQKKTYRSLQLTLQREDLSIPSGVVLEAMLEATEGVAAPAKRGRFKALCLLAPLMEDSCLAMLPLLLPEVILGVKEVNNRTRTQANDLLVSLGRRMCCGGRFQFGGEEEMEASVGEYFKMVMAGLAGGSPHMVSAAVMALARIIFEFIEKEQEVKDDLMMDGDSDDDVMINSITSTLPTTHLSTIGLTEVQSLTADISTLLQSPSREIVKSAISFIKVSLVVLPSNLIEPLLPVMIEGLLKWATVHHQQFKVQVKHLLERLMRRFGEEEVEAATPKEHLPLLANIKKTRDRRTNKKKQKDGADDVEGGSVVESQRSRFERAVNYSDDDSQDEAADDSADESTNRTDRNDRNDGKSVISALSKKLSLHSLQTQRVSNISRKQQQQLLINQQQQQSKKQMKRARAEESDSEDAEDGKEDYDVKVSDGKLMVFGGMEAEANLSRPPIQSFIRSADGKRVKFARGTKDSDDSDDENDVDEKKKKKDGSKSTFSSSSAKSSTSSKISRLSRGSAMSGVASSLVASSSIHSGSQFRGSGKGDAKRKDAKFDPYAYVPIQRAGKNQNKNKKKGEDKYFMKRR